MIMLKTIRGRRIGSLLKLQRPSGCLRNPSYGSSEFLLLSSVFWRPISLSSVFSENTEKNIQQRIEPLSVFFKGAVELIERDENSGFGEEDNSGNANLKDKLRNLEEEVRGLNKERNEEGKTLKLLSKKRELNVGKGPMRSLLALFSDKKKKAKLLEPIDFGNEDPMVYKELSSDMQMFTRHLYKKGYLKDAPFMPKSKLDLTCFEVSYAREYLKFAAVNFGKDHQEIAKWLSASDLKKIALFGCPSLGRRANQAAKHMRKFFGIEESQVCQKCTLKDSCQFANKKFKKVITILRLSHVTRVLTMYAMESVPKQLVVPEEINNSVSRLLNEIINLSQTKS